VSECVCLNQLELYWHPGLALPEQCSPSCVVAGFVCANPVMAYAGQMVQSCMAKTVCKGSFALVHTLVGRTQQDVTLRAGCNPRTGGVILYRNFIGLSRLKAVTV
jgi:hypothetical protein